MLRSLTVCLPCAACLIAVGDRGGGGLLPDPGGGPGRDTPACVTFDDSPDDAVGSDGLGPYCDDRRAKIEAVITGSGHVRLDTNTSNRTGAGRSLRIDFCRPITLVSADEITFQSTDELDFPHDADVVVGPFNDNVDLFDMAVGETRTDITLWITLLLHPPGHRQEIGLFIRFDPQDLRRGCPDSSFVSVTRDSAETWTIDTLDAVACVGEWTENGMVLFEHGTCPLPFSALVAFK